MTVTPTQNMWTTQLCDCCAAPSGCGECCELGSPDAVESRSPPSCLHQAMPANYTLKMRIIFTAENASVLISSPGLTLSDNSPFDPCHSCNAVYALCCLPCAYGSNTMLMEPVSYEFVIYKTLRQARLHSTVSLSNF